MMNKAWRLSLGSGRRIFYFPPPYRWGKGGEIRRRKEGWRLGITRECGKDDHRSHITVVLLAFAQAEMRTKLRRPQSYVSKCQSGERREAVADGQHTLENPNRARDRQRCLESLQE